MATASRTTPSWPARVSPTELAMVRESRNSRPRALSARNAGGSNGSGWSRVAHGAGRAGHADCGIATRSVAKSAGLDFVPLLWESLDLLMRQRSYFRPNMQALIGFLRESRLKQRALELSGYDTTEAGQIRFAA